MSRGWLLCLILFLLMSSIAYSFPYKGLDIKIKGAVGEMYDDNITSAIDGNKKEDFITNLTLGLGAKYEGKTHSLEFMGNLNHQIFTEHNNFDNTSGEFSLNLQSEFTEHERISLKNVFIHTFEPSDFEEALGRTTGRYSFDRNIFNLSYTRDITKELSLNIRYANELNKFLREDLKDSSLNTIGFGTGYSINPTTNLLFSYDFRKREFEDGKDASTHTISTGVRQYITPRLYFDGKFGIDRIISYDNKKYTKPIIGISITDEIDKKTISSLSFSKQYQTGAYRESLFNSWRTSGALTRELLERLGCFLSAFYGKGEYVTLEITEKFWGANIGFTYDFMERLKGNFTYTYFNKNSTVLTEEYSKNTIFLGLTTEF